MRVNASDDVSAQFEAHVSPVRDGLLRLIEVSEQLEEQWGSLPAADSRAMGEIASESKYAGGEPWGDEPARQAHHLAGMLLVGSTDCTRSACRLLAEAPTPAYAHMVLARSALEHAGRAWWLLDARIGIRERIARGFNDRLNGLAQQDFLPIPPADKRRARERRKALFAEADRLGFRKVTGRRQLSWIEEHRPTPTALVRKLLGDDQETGLGTTVYWLFSAVDHGTTSGLSQSIDADAPQLPQTPGVTWGAVYTSSAGVCSVLSAILLGLGRALQARNDLFGWPSEAWSQAHMLALRASRTSLESYGL